MRPRLWAASRPRPARERRRVKPLNGPLSLCLRSILATLLVLFSLGSSSSFAQSVRHVDVDAPGGGDGLSWATAFNDLQDALDEALIPANAITEIRVAEGTYLPSALTDAGDPRSATFGLIDGVAIRGGYAGFGEASPDDRDLNLHPTILSGDLNSDDVPVADLEKLADMLGHETREENSFHVVTSIGTGSTAVLDGFTITGGIADGTFGSPKSLGGGMLNDEGSPTLIRCTFASNAAISGAGIANRSGDPELIHCAFIQNFANNFGGGLHNQLFEPGAPIPAPKLINCLFDRNGATQGAGVSNFAGSSPVIVSSTLAGNVASGQGGGIYNNPGDPVVTNSVLWGNIDGDAMGTVQSAQIHVVGGTPAVDHSLIQDDDPDDASIFPGLGNIDDDPLLSNADAGDLRLTSGSPAIDVGDNGAVDLPATDLDGLDRISNGTVDMGAFEFQDCNDNGTSDLTELDTDGDGLIDDCDSCSADPDKIEPGVCGCGVAETVTDTDGDSVIDCLDACPGTIAGVAVDATGCPSPPIPGDFDRDGDVDGTDYVTLEACLDGPDVSIAEGCDSADLDQSGFVDLGDVSVFQGCFSGENQPGDPACAS